MVKKLLKMRKCQLFLVNYVCMVTVKENVTKWLWEQLCVHICNGICVLCRSPVLGGPHIEELHWLSSSRAKIAKKNWQTYITHST